METERTRRRFSDPIPGFAPRLRRAIGRRHPSITGCGEALGFAHSTLMSWLTEKNSPRFIADLLVLSAGLGVSVDWLVFGVEREGRDWVESTMGRRLRRCILERYDSLGAFRRRLGITNNMLRRWLGGRGRPEMLYMRQMAAMLDVSLDWLVRGEAWETTLKRQEKEPREVAAVLAARTLERMASRTPDPELGAALELVAKRAGKVQRRRVYEGQDSLPFV